MASATEVKEYLAYWFQLGKSVVYPKGPEFVCPQPIFHGDAYSSEFEASWERILASKEDCYLQGTDQSLRELLTSEWELIRCARCTLPIPTSRVYPPSCLCPCTDLSSWPNLELPFPRLPIKNLGHLQRVKDRLQLQDQRELG